MGLVQGYLVHKKLRTPRTLQEDYAQGPMVVLGGVADSDEQGSPVGPNPPKITPPHLKLTPASQVYFT